LLTPYSSFSPTHNGVDVDRGMGRWLGKRCSPSPKEMVKNPRGKAKTPMSFGSHKLLGHPSPLLTSGSAGKARPPGRPRSGHGRCGRWPSGARCEGSGGTWRRSGGGRRRGRRGAGGPSGRGCWTTCGGRVGKVGSEQGWWQDNGAMR